VNDNLNGLQVIFTSHDVARIQESIPQLEKVNLLLVEISLTQTFEFIMMTFAP
jgi:hypothetical protein